MLHPLMIQRSDTLVDRAFREGSCIWHPAAAQGCRGRARGARVPVVGVREPGPPVTEVGRHDKDIRGVRQVGCQGLAEGALLARADGTDEDGYDGDVLAG